MMCDKNLTQELHLFTDGASRGNPGEAGIGCYICVFDKKKKIACQEIFKKGFYIGKTTNNQAEYLALIVSLIAIYKKLGNYSKIVAHSDSLLLVNQLSKIWEIKNSKILVCVKYITSLIKDLPIKFVHVKREKNDIADTLANEGIDKKNLLPESLSWYLHRHNLL